MRTTGNVTPELMERIWLLHGKGIKSVDISTVLSISHSTVCRVISIMETAARGDIDELNAMCGGGYANQKRYAMKCFGLEASANKQQNNADADNTAYCMANIIQLLTSINQNLVALCNELGVKREGQ